MSRTLKIPLAPSPLPSPLGRGKREKGVGERGHFRHFHGFRVPVSRRAWATALLSRPTRHTLIYGRSAGVACATGTCRTEGRRYRFDFIEQYNSPKGGYDL